MKKNILCLIFAMAAFIIASPSQAQIKFGVKAGLNVNNISLKNIEGNIDKKNRNGFIVGVTADVTIPLAGLGADVSLLYDNRCIGLGSKVNYTYDVDGVPFEKSYYSSSHKTFHYIDLPINVKYTFGFSSLASAYLATGPQFSWNIGDRHWRLNKSLEQGWELNKSVFSWNVGCGATVLSHVRIGYNYNIALGKTAEISYKNGAEKIIKGKLKNNTHQITLTYLF